MGGGERGGVEGQVYEMVIIIIIVVFVIVIAIVVITIIIIIPTVKRSFLSTLSHSIVKGGSLRLRGNL